jgi:predicted transposase/invertase (TIGR01784 family)
MRMPNWSRMKREFHVRFCEKLAGKFRWFTHQMDWTKDFAQRALYGASQAYTGQLKRGEDYKKLSPVYALALINENFDKSDEYYHHYTFRNEKNDAKIDGIELIFVELLKFQVTTATERRLQALWLRFLNEAETMVEIPEEYLGVEEFEEAFELSQESGFTRAELDHYNTYWDSVSSEKTLLEGKFDEGVERGREEGIAIGGSQRSFEIARKMKKRGRPMEEIMEDTGLSQEEIESLE